MEGDYVNFIYLDLRKAFDKISHYRLQEKIKKN